MDQKVRGLLAYLFGWLGGLIVLLAFKDNTRETKKHAAQSLVFFVLYLIVIMIVSSFNFVISLVMAMADNSGVSVIFGLLSLVIGIICFALSIIGIVFKVMGMIKAYQEKEFNVPVISGLTEKLFKSKLA